MKTPIEIINQNIRLHDVEDRQIAICSVELIAQCMIDYANQGRAPDAEWLRMMFGIDKGQKWALEYPSFEYVEWLEEKLISKK